MGMSNLTTGGRIVWDKGLGAEDGSGWFRVWGTSVAASSSDPSASQSWGGQLEEVQLWDAGHALETVKQHEGRVPDLLYLNCEGCEYEVLQRLGATAWLSVLPRIAVSWHAGGAPWVQRCTLDALLRNTHHVVTNACSWE